MKLRDLLALSIVSLLLALEANAEPKACPDQIQRIEYQVSPKTPKKHTTNSINIALDLQLPSRFLNEDDKQFKSSSFESVAIGGLITFLEERARAELRLWLSNAIRSELCSSNSKRYFRDTCQLQQSNTDSYLSINNSYEVFVDALRTDLRYLPACAVYQHKNNHNPTGYWLQSVYDQYSKGGDLQSLLNGLTEQLLSSTRIQCRYINQEFVGKNCGTLIPLLSYSAMTSASDLLAQHEHSGKEEYMILAIAAYYDTLTAHPRFRELRQEVFEKEKQLKSKIKLALKKKGEYYAKLTAELNDMHLKLQQFYALKKTIKARIHEAQQQADKLSRQHAAEILTQINNLVTDQLILATTLRLDNQTIVAKFTAQVKLLESLAASYNAIHTHEYSIAIAKLRPVLQHIRETAATEQAAALERFNAISGAVTQLAEAKTSDEFAQTLDSLASPIGGWKMRHHGNLFSINAYTGVRWGEDRYDLSNASLTDTHYIDDNVTGAVFAPIGLQYTWNTRIGAVGPFVSLLDLGYLIEKPAQVNLPNGYISNDIDSELSNIFAPGLYLTLAPFKTLPLTIGVGRSYGPKGYRDFIHNDGNETAIDREWSDSAFIAVDLMLLPLN